MGGRVAGAVDQIKHFFGVGQADDQRMIAPIPLREYSMPVLAFAYGPLRQVPSVSITACFSSFLARFFHTR